MSKAGLHISAEATAVQGPRGLSIKEFKFKETLSNGDNVYQVILENNTVIGELTAKKGDKGLKGDTGEDGNGIISILFNRQEDTTRYYTVTYTNGMTNEIIVENGDSAYDIAVTNGFNGTEEEWLESLIGKGLEFEWKGTELGVRVEGETVYKYVDLKGQTGEAGRDGINGKNLEFTWRGTELGVRVQGQSDYQYVNLKGEKGEAGVNGTNGVDGVGIKDVTLKGQDSDGGNIYTITLTNETTKEFIAPRGPKGEGASVDLTNYYTKPEIDTKFKNYPVPVGGVLLMYNNTNPAEVYAGTTWELLASDKYLKTTTGTPLSTGGSNSFTIQKANLPAVKIQLESFSVTTQPHKHTIGSEVRWNEHLWANSRRYLNAGQNNFDVKDTTDPCGSGGGANTGTASPYTQNLGNGTAISVNPTYITIRVWKRLS